MLTSVYAIASLLMLRYQHRTRDREPTNEEVRSIVAASFPYLKHPPPKPRNPNAPPSASLPPKASAAEQAARIASLVIGLEDVETRSVLKGQVVLER